MDFLDNIYNTGAQTDGLSSAGNAFDGVFNSAFSVMLILLFVGFIIYAVFLFLRVRILINTVNTRNAKKAMMLATSFLIFVLITSILAAVVQVF